MNAHFAYPALSRRQFLQTTAGAIACGLSAGCTTGRRTSGGDLARPLQPLDIGNRVAEYVVANQLDRVDYPTVCCAYGVLRFARVSDNSSLRRRVETLYADYLTGTKIPDRYPNGRPVEHRWFGILPLELGFARDPRYGTVATREADLADVAPTKDGELYYVDYMYGVGTVLAKAFIRLLDARYADRCISHLLTHSEALQRQDGLFNHSERGRQAWGRGNGWAAAAATEALLALPPKHPRRDELLQSWRRLMDAIVQRQDAQGRWHQIVDLPESWLETSGSAMFVFSLATGVRAGWLRGGHYRAAAEKGWRALAAAVDASGQLADVCIGLGDDPGTEAHYLACPRKLGDKHGQGPLLWAASAMLELQ